MSETERENEAGADTGADAVMESTSAEMTAPNLKRRASPSFEGLDEDSRKRMKESSQLELAVDGADNVSRVTDHQCQLADDLTQDLECPCCSALSHNPVIVLPCQHVFCGSCCVLWVKNGGMNCPACRGACRTAVPSKPLQTVIDSLIRAVPSRARPEREREQADKIYKPYMSIRFPSPREPSPEPDLDDSRELARPCPTCPSSNPYGWSCPTPIPDPLVVGPDRAWQLENGLPAGHARCGNCVDLLGLGAPMTTRCDFCLVSFCGIAVRGRCQAVPLRLQEPEGLSSVDDLLTSRLYEDSFASNMIEANYLIDYLASNGVRPRHIYQQIVTHISAKPRGFYDLIEDDLFVDIHSVSGGVDADPESPRSKICRKCAREIFFYGLKDWWIRERRKGGVDEAVLKRPDCPEGLDCERQMDQAHANEFNHIVGSSVEDTPGPLAPSNDPLPMGTEREGSNEARLPFLSDLELPVIPSLSSPRSSISPLPSIPDILGASSAAAST